MAGMLTRLARLEYPYYFAGPCDLVVYVPARFYLTMRVWVEHAREIGTRVTVLIDEL
jgi:hypothetical protein